ncbi:type II secretion system F family protein [Marinicella gelatinilytica]|uniref:type II secretion system F family protein n=1 Tax=Marinicella gelatinilytica TaxID=2996017 RepID=UPI002260DD4D|nr:type II secretion system F family protein [Marinicella gelatinilytica]MCX7544087.1 type II secretion system F family protein [Marinicella gelatinilytica]
MAQFIYKAITPAGEPLEGQIEALSKAEVIAKIQDAGNMPISAKELKPGFSLENLLARRSKVSAKQVNHFTEQLATLLSSGMPLDRSLSVMIDLNDDERLRPMIEQVRDKVRGGGTLSDALEDQHGVFSNMYTNMVRAGEMGGTLETSLERLNTYLQSAKELRDSVVSAMIYPAILLVLSVGSLFILLAKVVPKFEPLFADANVELPMLTQVVFAGAALVQSFWWLIVLVVVVVVLLLRQKLKEPDFRYRWDQRKLKLPLFGELITRVETAKFTRTLGTLVDSGVPLLSGLMVAKKVVANTVIAQAIANATEKVKHGSPLAEALAKEASFPKLAQQLLGVGEETGHLDAMLVRTSDAYDGEVKNTIDRMLSVLVPALVLVLAAMIFTIVFAILMPMMNMSELVG